MDKKKQGLDAKLGSWAAQANLSRSQVDPVPQRDVHLLERSLTERLGSLSAEHNVSMQHLIGHLLTWSLDQVDKGQHKIDL